MKTLITYLLAGAALFSLTACEELEKLGDIELGIPLEKTIPVNIAVPTNLDGSATFSYTDAFKLADNSDVEPYLETIKEINIKSIKARVTDFVGGPNVEFSGNIVLNEEVTLGINQITLAENAEVILEDNDGAYFKLAEFLRNQKEASYNATLNVSAVPVEFNLKLIVELEIKAGVLK
jgi:hypothetical protein